MGQGLSGAATTAAVRLNSTASSYLSQPTPFGCAEGRRVQPSAATPHLDEGDSIGTS